MCTAWPRDLPSLRTRLESRCIPDPRQAHELSTLHSRFTAPVPRTKLASMSFGRPPVFKEGRVKNYTREQWEAALRKATGVVDRHKGERVERDKKTDCAHQTRRDSPRIQEL